MCGGLSYLVGDFQLHTAVDDIVFKSVQADDLLIAAAVAEILLCYCPEGISVRYGMNAIVLGGFHDCHGKCGGLDRRHDGVLAGLILVDDGTVAADLDHIPAELLHPAGNGFAVIVGAARDGHEVTDLDRPGGLGGFGRLYIGTDAVAVDDEELFINTGNTSATGMVTSEGFVVLKGAVVNEKTSAKSLSAGMKKLRDKIFADGKVENMTTTEDILFSSSSAAAEFVLGYSASGPRTWKAKDGRTLKEIEDNATAD